MEENEFGPVEIKDMDKCAIIYRSSSVSFIYVCYHCGANFTDINSTLKHIESHFQLVQITIDEKNVKSECVDTENELEADSICETTDPVIKAEVMEIEEICDGDSLERTIQFDCKRCGSTFPSKFAFRSHTVKEHFNEQSLECEKCGRKFKREASMKNHIRQHIEWGEVDWNCEGDGVRVSSSSSSIGSGGPKKQENASLPVQIKRKSEKLKPEKRQSKKLKPEILKPEEHESEKQKPEKKKQEKQKPEKQKPEKQKPEKQKPEKLKPEKQKPVKSKPAKLKLEKLQSEKVPSEKKSKTSNVRSRERPPQLSIYICHKCSDTYSTSNDLNEHLNSHTASDVLQLNKCKECKIYFPTDFELRLHVLDIHLSLTEFKCSTCFVEFKKDDKLSLEKHLELHLATHSAKWVNIRHGVCNNGMDATNFEEITTTSDFSCDLCEEKFYLKSNLEEHVKDMHWDNENKLRCPQCEAVFTKMKSYFAHQLEHRRVGATVTETDTKLLTNNLNSYIDEQFVCNAAENASNPYKCSICYIEKNNLSEIRLHVRERHVYKTLPQPIKPILKEKSPCNICGMIITRNSLRAHYLTHVASKKFPCSFCGRIFSKNYSKKTHERMHTGEKPYQCDQCGKRFFSNSLLGAHKQSHDNTTYPCKICGRVFNIPSGYRRHMQTHRKDQSFECTICSKSFNTRVYLTRHIHKHNEKTFQCSFCENKFRSAKGKRQHEKIQHNYEPPI